MEPVHFKLNELNDDLLRVVFRNSTPEGLCLCRKVCHDWREKITEDVWREVIYKCFAFGPKEYQNYFNHKVKHIELPLNIHDEIMKVFRFSVANEVTKTPMLVLIDPCLTLKKIGELVHPFLGYSFNGYLYIAPQLFIEKENENSDVGVNQKCKKDPYWVIMMNGGMLRNKSYDVQSNIPLQVPTTEEAVACIYAKYVISKSCEFNKITYIRTQNMIDGFRVVVGGFDESGLYVDAHNDQFDHKIRAIAGLQRLRDLESV